MEIPITNPQLNLSGSLDDHSANDDSIHQDGGITINASGQATINSNSGNGHAKHGYGDSVRGWGMSIICDLIICCFFTAILLWTVSRWDEKSELRHAEIHQQITQVATNSEKSVKEMQESAKAMVAESKEGTIWILRRDILHSIEKHEAEKTITYNDYKRIIDEFNFYHQIGGNHDVEGRVEDFKTKIFGTKEITMTK